ncbi:MAG: hypothetical protein QNJ54_20850 [Prochloraceae cyanobacterium]|nr:hypothetical protein [Prochloraceae cyanobacterium]
MSRNRNKIATKNLDYSVKIATILNVYWEICRKAISTIALLQRLGIANNGL